MLQIFFYEEIRRAVFLDHFITYILKQKKWPVSEHKNTTSLITLKKGLFSLIVNKIKMFGFMTSRKKYRAMKGQRNQKNG